MLALAVAGSADLLRSSLVGAALLGGPLLVTHLVSPAGMGFGDVKAGAVAGAALGLIDPQLAVLALVLGLAAAASWGLAPPVPHRAVRPRPGRRRPGRAAHRPRRRHRGGGVVSVRRLLAIGLAAAGDLGRLSTTSTTRDLPVAEIQAVVTQG